MIKNKPKMFVIEDDFAIQELLSAFFIERGYEVEVFADGQAALDCMESHLPKPDVIITDLMLPNFSGIELTKKFLAQGIEAPVIVITANGRVENAVEAIRAGAYDFVVKPIEFSQLMISIERALKLNQIRAENENLKKIVRHQSEAVSVDGIICRSPELRRVLDLAQRVSKSSSNLLITGESGTGKEVIAKLIHGIGTRKGPFVAINCSAIPENLLESELFGHAKGSFTGAFEKKVGLFEAAQGGTLFLDEIGDLSLSLQAKVLRVLQERKIKRLGENQFRPIDVRIVSATHKDLRHEIANKTFREDLFFRLNVIPIRIPPLRDRREDIIPLAEFFLKKFSIVNKSNVSRFSKEALEWLLKNFWQGNVRELENTIERVVVLSDSDTVQLHDLISFEICEPKKDVLLDSSMKSWTPTPYLENLKGSKIITLNRLTNSYIKHVLAINRGAKDQTAKDLGIDRKTLYRRIHEMDREPVLD